MFLEVVSSGAPSVYIGDERDDYSEQKTIKGAFE